MTDKKAKFLIILLSMIFLFTCFSIEADQLYTKKDAWKEENVYRPTPLLFLHGFGPGSPATWSDMTGKLSEDHYDRYFPPSSSPPRLGRLQGPDYLERISFKDDSCGSVDTYPNGNPGWSDKVNDAMSNILQRYDKTDKVILICHSMGGLAGRYYMLALGGDSNTDKYVSIDTPHCGAKLADIANGIEIAQVGSLIFGGWGGFLFAAVTEVINQSAVKIGDIDIHGDAVNDMDPDGEFITNLINMGTGSGSKSRCVVGQIGSAKNFILFGSYYGGDGVVSVRTQQAIDKNGYTTWNFYDTCVVTASHSNTPKNSKTYDQILKWVDKEKPELGLVRVLESVKELNLEEEPEKESGNWDNKDTDWTEHIIGEGSQPFLLDLDKYGRAYIEGKVDEEYLPATTKVDIKVYKEGETTVVWDNTPETSLLKPYADMQPAPAGFRYEVLFAKDKYTAPESGVYDIKVFVENPAGLKSEGKSVKVRIGAGHYFHVSLSPEYVETSGDPSQTQAFTITVQCYNYGTSETKPQVEGERYVDKKEGTESWWHYVNDEQDIDEWRKEKINPNCIAPEQWEKSDYTGEVSFGLNTSGYELYAGGEKLETLELIDGTGTISGAVIKAKDGDISSNHLFLIISASDGTGSGNGALMVNPVVVNMLESPFGKRKAGWTKFYTWNETIYDEKWSETVAFFLSEPWSIGGGHVGFFGRISHWDISYGLTIDYRSRTDRFNLSEESIGYTPEQLKKAWMRIPIGDVRQCEDCTHSGGIKNATTGEMGVLKYGGPHEVWMYFYNIPISDFGNSIKDYALKPSLDPSDTGNVKPPYTEDPYYSYKGISTIGGSQILFIPKTE